MRNMLEELRSDVPIKALSHCEEATLVSFFIILEDVNYDKKNEHNFGCKVKSGRRGI